MNPAIDNCEQCDAPIPDTDRYAICTDPWGGNATVLCENCREIAAERHQQHLMETGGGPSLIEQQRAAWLLK
jgi:hypothetical protein